jgi:hypothetical protein
LTQRQVDCGRGQFTFCIGARIKKKGPTKPILATRESLGRGRQHHDAACLAFEHGVRGKRGSQTDESNALTADSRLGQISSKPRKMASAGSAGFEGTLRNQ